MSLLTSLALRRRSVTILAILLALVGGLVTYRSLEVELFPEIEFPNITIVTFYPSANPEAVVRDVTDPIENAIAGISGVKEVQSVSSENRSLVFANFEFGEDMEEAERTIESNLNGVRFPSGVEDPIVSRINNDVFPVLQLSVVGERDIPSLQRLMDDLIVPPIEQVDGVFSVDVLGRVDEQVLVTVDIERLEDLGLSMQQVSNAIRDNNLSVPAGDIQNRGTSFAVRTSHEFGSLDDIRNLVVGFEQSPAPAGAPPGAFLGGPLAGRSITVSDIADVALGTSDAESISQTNGKPSLSVAVIKDPEANTVDVTSAVLEVLESLEGLPPDVELITISNDGPEIEEQILTLQREGMLGFLFAVAVVFAFLLNIRPRLLRGVAFTLRPTMIIAVSIPLSIFTGILMMGAVGLSLNFMTLAGLAIAVGRVVDDSIVVLENIYRHIQRGEDRFEAAFTATREVAGAITASTLTTIVVFAPLAFIQGLVGSFFTPFAMSVSFALIGSTLVALTAVPVLGAIVLRRGDFGEGTDDGGDRDTWMQRLYTPALLWALRHRALTLLAAVAVTVASLGLTVIIPVTLFPAGPPQFMTIDVELPSGASAGRTFAEILKVEELLARLESDGMVEAYQTTIGGSATPFGPVDVTGAMNLAGVFVRFGEDTPEELVDDIRSELPGDEETTITITELQAGPPTDELEVTVTGGNFTSISGVARQLAGDFGEIDGVVNVKSDVTEARDEVVVSIDPEAASEFGLTTGAVALQVKQFVVGQEVTEVDLEGETMDIVVRGPRRDVDDIEKLKSLNIEGPRGRIALGTISTIAVEKGPVSISRFDGERSASITGTITAADTQAIGVEVQAKIDAVDLPPGIEVRTGGIFQQVAEGFEDIFLAMAVGIILVYLVMVATLGSLRNPFIIVLSLPLALVGALIALAVTGRTLSLSALMGFLLLVGVVVTNAIVLIVFVQQLQERGRSVYDALVEGGRTRLRPILMTAFTTTFALFPLAFSTESGGGLIGAEMATVVIGGLASSTFLTLIVVPVLYMILHVSLPAFLSRIRSAAGRALFSRPAVAIDDAEVGD